MNLGLASDDSNRNFQGATNPDSALHVTFYDKEFINEFESKKQGKPVKYMALMVRIERPGDILNVADRLSTTDDERRFPVQYANYINMRNGRAGDLVGTPLSECQLISKEQAEQLRSLHFYTMEQVANSSDAQINGIGMIAGMAPMAFRDRIRMALRVATDTTTAQKLEKQVEESLAREKAMAETVAKMQEQMAQLIAAQDNKLHLPKK